LIQKIDYVNEENANWRSTYANTQKNMEDLLSETTHNKEQKKTRNQKDSAKLRKYFYLYTILLNTYCITSHHNVKSRFQLTIVVVAIADFIDVE
jgi:hypothetical protein